MQEREEEVQRQSRILGQQQQAQHAKHAAADAVRAVPALAGKRRLDILYSLQDLVDKRYSGQVRSIRHVLFSPCCPVCV